MTDAPGAAHLDFGSLNDALARSCAAENLARSADAEFREFAKMVPDDGNPFALAAEEGHVVNLLRSAGPISDAYILATDPAALIIGPGGSGKTTASAKKILLEGQRISPGANGVRRYVAGTWRQKYVNLWKATIPSYWKVIPKDLPGSTWHGAPPRDATHIVRFEDQWGRVEIETRFRAFGDTMDPEDLLGNEFTDCYLNEWPTLPEELFIALVDRVGRDPPMEVTGRPGCFFGDGNAPDVLSYCYRDWYETPKPGHVLYRQPGGLDPLAENRAAMPRSYYENSVRMNAHRPWWVRRMVHARPGFTRAVDPIYPTFDDERNVAKETIPVIKELPILVGEDGGLTPAVAYCQEKSNGQLRILAEIALERGGMRELAAAMLHLEATRFPDHAFERRSGRCDFVDTCDPSMGAGEDTDDGSDRSTLSEVLGRQVALDVTNNPDIRWGRIREKLALQVEDGPGLLLDPSCKGLRRGFNQTYAFRNVSGTNDRGSVSKTFDSHVHDALQAAAAKCGTDYARRRITDRDQRRRETREKNRTAKRYSPLRRSRG